MALFDRDRRKTGFGLVIIDATLDKLLIDLFGCKEFPAELLGLLDGKAFAAINVDGNIILGGERVDDDGTLNQRSPTREARLIRKPVRVRTKNARWGLLFHAEIRDDVVEELVAQPQIIADTFFASVKVQ